MEELMVVISARAASFNAAIAKAQATLQHFGAAAESIAASARNVGLQFGVMGGAASVALGDAVHTFSEMGDALDKMALRTGVAVESLSRLQYIADLSGTSLAAVEIGLRSMSRVLINAASGSDSAADAFTELGLSVAALRGQDPESQFTAIAEAIKAVEDPTLRSALAMQIFGRAGTQLLPLLLEGKEGFDAMSAAIASAGGVITTDMAHQAAELNDTLANLHRTVTMAKLAIGGALAPALLEIIPRLQAFIVASIEWAKTHKTIILVVGGVVAALAILGTALAAVGAIAAGIAAAISLIGAAPIIAGIAAVAAGIGGIAIYFGLLKKKTGESADAASSWSATYKKALASAQSAMAAMPSLDDALADQGKATPLQTARKAVTDLSASLREQIVTYGESQRAVELYKASLAVWNLPISQQAQFNNALAETERRIAVLDRADAFAKLRGSIADLISGLREQVENFGLSDTQAALANAIRNFNAAPADQREALAPAIQQAAALTQRLEALRAAQDAATHSRQQWEETIRHAADITQSLRDPLEVMQDTIADLNELLAQGLISMETFQRGVAKAHADALSTLPEITQPQAAKSDIFQRIGAVDIQGLNIGEERGGIEKKLDDQTALQRQHLQTLQQIRDGGGFPA